MPTEQPLKGPGVNSIKTCESVMLSNLSAVLASVICHRLPSSSPRALSSFQGLALLAWQEPDLIVRQDRYT